MFVDKQRPFNQESESKKMNSTAEFREAVKDGKLEEAERFLNKVASAPEEFPQFDARWLDHRQRELFQAFNGRNDWAGAKRVIEATKSLESKQGRIRRLEELSGKTYVEI